jgi:hypothetical protein
LYEPDSAAPARIVLGLVSRISTRWDGSEKVLGVQLAEADEAEVIVTQTTLTD